MQHRLIQNKVRSRRISREVFINEEGAIDLASIMVGIIVIGLIGGVIAATIFAVIPWAQDNAAKQQLDSVKSAENAYRGLAEDKGVSAYGNNAELADPNGDGKTDDSLLDLKESNVLITTTPKPNPTYTARIKSASGRTFVLTNDGKITEIKDNSNGGVTTPPAGSTSLRLTGVSYTSDYSAFGGALPEGRKTLISSKQNYSDTVQQQLLAMVDKTNKTETDGISLDEGVKQAHSNYAGGNLYLVRPNNVTISADGKQLAQYSGSTGSIVLFGNVGQNLLQAETIVPASANEALQNASTYKTVYTFDNFTLTFEGGPSGYTISGPAGNGSDTATQVFNASSVNYAPVTDNNGQGFATQDEYDHALANRDTDFWSFQVTVNNPDPQSLPDLSDVPFTENTDGTYQASMKDGRWYKEAVFKFANGNTGMLVGNSDMASVNSDRNEYRDNLTVTLDANKKVTSLKLDYMGIRVPGYSTLAEAKAKLSGATVELYPYGTSPTDEHTQVSTTKTMKFTLK